MIRRLRYKFIIILMGVAAVILLAVFVSMFISTWKNSRQMSENMLRQALNIPPISESFKPPPNAEEQPSAAAIPPMGRLPLLVVEIDRDEKVTFVSNQLYFLDEGEAEAAVLEAIDTNEETGTLHAYGLRFLKSEDGRRMALVDISMEQETLRNLIMNSLLIGCASLAAFFLISLFLARWAVRPVELAWKRQQQFVADASHELKTPLTVILSNADMLSGDGIFTDEKKCRRVEHIRAEAVRMKKLIEDLLTLARSDSVEFIKVWECVDFSFVVTSGVLTFEPIIFDEQKKLSYDMQDNLCITGDAQRLQQLVAILLDNAVKYCPSGGQITVSLKEETKKSILLTVTNDGEPIPKEETTQVFERFHRVDKSRSTHGSFGLGLSIAQSIVAEHNGKIWVKSGMERGNCFYVTFPVC